MRFKLSIGERLLLASTVGVLTVVATVAGASASTGSTWKLGYYNTSGRSLSMSSATGPAPALASFNFTNQDNTALLITDQGADKTGLLGADNGKTISANFTIAGADTPFTYYGEPDGSGAPATVRLFFQTSGGGFAYTNYWWADYAFTPLGNGTFTLTALIDSAQPWSDWNGQSSATNTTAFTAAANDVTTIGLSFGGGYFFENGVGTVDGSGAFTLNSYALTP